MSAKNISEILFEKYLAEQGLTFEFEKTYPGKSRLVDYTVLIGGHDFLFEVKQFEQSNYPLPLSGPTAVNQYGPIRSKIDQARKKFKEYDGFPCCLVLYNNEAFVADDPGAMYGAMYGDVGIQIPLAAGRVTVAMPVPETTFVGKNGKMVKNDAIFNTRITAIISLYEYYVGSLRFGQWWKQRYALVSEGKIAREEIGIPEFDITEKRLAVSVWKNIYADIQFPDSAFNGPFDEHWGLVGDYVRCTYQGSDRVEDD
jgi:hypothetical protein